MCFSLLLDYVLGFIVTLNHLYEKNNNNFDQILTYCYKDFYNICDVHMSHFCPFLDVTATIEGRKTMVIFLNVCVVCVCMCLVIFIIDALLPQRSTGGL